MNIKDQYEQYLKNNKLRYKRDHIPIVYWDNDKQEKIYHIDFEIIRNDKMEWVTCIPHKELKPIKKHLYGKKIAEMHNIVFRGLNQQEINQLNLS